MYNSLWYYSLTKPELCPPDSIFAPIWSVLYATMIISIIIYTLSFGKNKFFGYLYFIVQASLNLIWPFAFFYLKNVVLAFFIIILLDILVILTISRFYRVSKIAAILLVPYFVWIIFATYLNFGYLILN